MHASETSPTKPPLFFKLFAVRQDVPFFVCLKEVLETEGLVENFNRLYGASLGVHKQPIELMVDQATGKANDDMSKFIDFCWDTVFCTFGADADTIWPNPQDIPELTEVMLEYFEKKSNVH